MGLVTIVGDLLAKKEVEFIYLGPLDECKKCKVKTACFNLKPYHTYKIINIREKKHGCSVHEGPGVVVEVEEQPIRTTIDKKLSKGSITQLEPKTCDNLFCSYHENCTTPAVQKGRKYKIDTILDDVDCDKGESLVQADVIET